MLLRNEVACDRKDAKYNGEKGHDKNNHYHQTLLIIFIQEM